MGDPPELNYARPLVQKQRGFFDLPPGGGRALLEIAAVCGILLLWGVLYFLVLQPLLAGGLDNPLYNEILVNGSITILAVALVSRLGGRTADQLGLAPRNLLYEVALGLGAVIPVCVFTVGLTLMLMLVLAVFDATQLDTVSQDRAVMMEAVTSFSLWSVLPAALFIGFYEEVLFRGFLMGRLAAATRQVWVAAVVSSIIFGLLHYPMQGWLGVVQTSVLGMLLAVLTIWRKRLWAAIACHAGIDAVMITLVLFVNWFMTRMEGRGIVEVLRDG